MKKLNLFLLALIACFIFSSCTDKASEAVTSAFPSDEESPIVDNTINKEVIANHLHGLNINLDNPEKILVDRPNGVTEELYLIENDITVTESQLRELRAEGTDGLRQYNTNNLVSSPRTITVEGYTGAGNALTSKMQTALSWAVANYNALNTGLYFSLSYGATTNANIVVYQVSGSAGGSAGFPSGGLPYKWVMINSGTDSYSTNLVEHVITHEIGHCIGMRHTDWFSRSSCGGYNNEGAGSIGANHIPGTPTGEDLNSLMEACFDGSEDGEFGYYDVVALEYLY